MPLRLLLCAVVLAAGCSSSTGDGPRVRVAPRCLGSGPVAIIDAGGCLDGGEFRSVARFTCGDGVILYGIENRWARPGDLAWTHGGMELWEECRGDT